ncbi:MAG: flagellar type III secretion system pore protein FliP [Planctomycetota bacterium]
MIQDPPQELQGPGLDGSPLTDPLQSVAQDAVQGPGIDLRLSTGALDPDGIGGALEIVLLMTVLSLAPAIIMTMTSFTRIVIVLSFLRRAMSIQELPPTLVVTGFAAFLSIFVMAPVFQDVRDNAYEPYVERQIDLDEALDRAGTRMNEFMLAQTRVEDLDLIVDLAGDRLDSDLELDPNGEVVASSVPFHVAVPAFVLSEIKTAFQMGFVLFLPFLVIDLVISSILISMGMFTLPPVVVSTPLKVLLFVLVDGWNLVVESLAGSFVEL